MKFFEKNRRKYLRHFGYAISLTTIAFIFQACYGINGDYKNDVYISGLVTDVDGNPIQGIRISNEKTMQYARTDKNGVFMMYILKSTQYELQFEDDSNKTLYERKDTILIDTELSFFTIKLNQK